MSDDDYRQDLPVKRGKGVRDEYSSESLDEEQVEVAEDDNASDSDMFASDKEEPEVVVNKGPKKLDMLQFEQELQLEGNHGDASDAEDVELEAFNLREEEEEGYFDEEGNFVRQQSDEEPEDDLLTADKHEIDKARKAQEAQRSAVVRISETTAELLTVLISNLEPDESPLEALARLAPPQKRRNKKAIVTDKELEQRQLVTTLTEVCDKLMIYKGVLDLYDMVREELMRLYRRETGQDFQVNRGVKRKLQEEASEEDSEDYGEKVWEFKWDDLDEINGPYSNYEMDYWKHNYFDHKVYVRRVGHQEFTHIDEVAFV